MTSVFFLRNFIKSIKWMNSSQEGDIISPTNGQVYYEVQ